jgi:hypothetical protein
MFWDNEIKYHERFSIAAGCCILSEPMGVNLQNACSLGGGHGCTVLIQRLLNVRWSGRVREHA